jgi:glycosyltransferase involved in cell wall biosynthesis
VSIKVLEVLPTLKRAGAERMAVSFAGGLDRLRFETGVVSLYDAFPGGLEPVLETKGVPTWHLGKRRGFDPRMYSRLGRLLGEFRPDIIHTHSYLLRYVRPAAAGARVRAMVHTVHNLAERDADRVGRLINRVCFRFGVVPVAAGAAIARSFRAVYGFEPAAVIANGIATESCSRPEIRQRWRQAHGFGPLDVLIASVGRLEPQKNPLGLIEAFATGLRDELHCHLLVAGDGSLRETVWESVERLGLDCRVHMFGVSGMVPEMLSSCDIFALASLWEGNPLSVMEAAAAGLPVVATAVGGVPDLVQHGETGILVPPGDTAAMAEALATLARDAERREGLGRTARARAARFDIGAMIDSYAALFERLLQERG